MVGDSVVLPSGATVTISSISYDPTTSAAFAALRGGEMATDTFTYTISDGNGGTSGEMFIRWEQVGNKRHPQLQVFDDAWSALALFGDLLQKMSEVDNHNISEASFVELLKSCGFEDMTPYDSPYEEE